jgi:hypothetical protein
VLILLFYSIGFELNSKILVPFANKTGTDLLFTDLGKLFINMKKSKGPKPEPWGTPC